jgi:hypothetical protein
MAWHVFFYTNICAISVSSPVHGGFRNNINRSVQQSRYKCNAHISSGSILCLFLGPDCGPKEGAIRLAPEKDTTGVSTITEESPPISPIEEEVPRGLVGSFGRKVSKKFSGIFASRVPDATLSTSVSTPMHLSTAPSRNRAFSRTSRMSGSAYGYNGAYRSRLASRGTLAGLAARRGSTAAQSYRSRRESNAANNEPPLASSFATGTDLNFAQRILMANENTVTSIADLWVAAAMNVDNEDPFESEDEFVPQEDERVGAETPENEFDGADIFALDQTPRQDRFIRGSSASPLTRPGMLGSPLASATSQRRESINTRRGSTTLQASMGMPNSATHIPIRRFSNSVAPIFAHVGVRTPPAVVEAQQLLAMADEVETSGQDTLAPITEGPRVTDTDTVTATASAQEPSLMSQLPLLIIFQYGLLALHSTTHDQIFYLYLVSCVSSPRLCFQLCTKNDGIMILCDRKYPSGGLNLNAGHFSQLSKS